MLSNKYGLKQTTLDGSSSEAHVRFTACFKTTER